MCIQPAKCIRCPGACIHFTAVNCILDDDDPLAQVDLVDIFGPDLGGSSDEKTP